MTKKLKELLPQIHRRESFRFTLITVLSSAKIDLIFECTKFFRKNKADASPEPFPPTAGHRRPQPDAPAAAPPAGKTKVLTVFSKVLTEFSKVPSVFSKVLTVFSGRGTVVY